MRILIVGDWHSELHEEPVFNALKLLGNEVYKFQWYSYFKSFNFLDEFNKKLQNRLILGPIIRKINLDLVVSVTDLVPDMIFVYRGTHITSNTLKKIKSIYPHTTLVGYNNDDPFAKGHHYSLWRHFLKAVPYYDLMYAYRQHNLYDFLRAGAKHVELLRSWYFPERNYPIELTDQDKINYECDVVFVGHYEPDYRKEYLEELVRQGFKVKLFGPGNGWNKVLVDSPELNHLLPVYPVLGDDYNKALCGAKIALCFLSKLNRDTYTRRCFEIPATKTFMLSEYTDDLASLYVEGVHVAFFRSKQDFIEKVRIYVGNEKLRKKVALNGYKQVIADEHDVVSRMRNVMSTVKLIKLN